MASVLTITPCLWFDTEAEEAARFYVSVFPDAAIERVAHYGKEGFDVHGQPAGSVLTVTFRLLGTGFVALNGWSPFQVQRGSLVHHPVRGPGGDRSLLGGARRRRRCQGAAMRLAQGPVRPFLADRAARASGDDERSRSRKIRACDEGAPPDEEARSRGIEACL